MNSYPRLLAYPSVALILMGAFSDLRAQDSVSTADGEDVIAIKVETGPAVKTKNMRSILKRELESLKKGALASVNGHISDPGTTSADSRLRSMGGAVRGYLSSGSASPTASGEVTPHFSASAITTGRTSSAESKQQIVTAASPEEFEKKFRQKALEVVFDGSVEAEEDLTETQSKEFENLLSSLQKPLEEAKSQIHEAKKGVLDAADTHSNTFFGEGSLDVLGLGLRYGKNPGASHDDPSASGTAELHGSGSLGFSTIGRGPDSCGFLLAGSAHLDMSTSFKHLKDHPDAVGKALAGLDLDIGGICRISEDVHAVFTAGPSLAGGMSTIPVLEGDGAQVYGPMAVSAKVKVTAKDRVHVTGESTFNFADSQDPGNYNLLQNKLRVRVNTATDPNSRRTDGLMIGVDGGYNVYINAEEDKAKSTPAVAHEGQLGLTVGRAW